ncbi:hypothetical protein GGR52DRAFT_563700 [Hypoxylon sp. FL1284]|nr:hypothetical protein GGR52DRAFT_563700 [Hypoxylon sp. FL1284]
MANLGPLTTVFTPSGTGCQSIHIGLESGSSWVQQGTISDCFPSNFLSHNGYYYSPGICPQSFTYACKVGVALSSSTATAATCCPRYVKLHFAEKSERDNVKCGLAEILIDDGSTVDFPVARTGRTAIPMLASQSWHPPVLTSSTGTPIMINTTTAFRTAGEPVYAKGVAVWRAASDPEWPATATPSSTTFMTGSPSLAGLGTTPATTESTPAATASMPTATGSGSDRDSDVLPAQTASPGLSTGGKVGLGVGISAGVLLFVGAVAAAYLLGRRKKHGFRSKPALHPDNGEEKSDLMVPSYELEEQRRVAEMSSQREPAELGGSWHEQSHM